MMDPSPSFVPDGVTRLGEPRRPKRPVRFQWLVSVRSLREALLATQFDIDILDLKEPREGALAPLSPDRWRSISDSLRDAFDDKSQNGGPLPPPISVALGESSQALECVSQLPEGIRFAKAGPADCATTGQISRLWSDLKTRLRPGVELVAVAYADHERARTLPPETLLELAAERGFKRVLLDTFDKRCGSVVDVMGWRALDQFAAAARQQNLWWALAGSIRLEQVKEIFRRPPISGCRPNCVAARGALCDGDRTASLCRLQMNRWQQEKNGGDQTQSSPVIF